MTSLLNIKSIGTFEKPWFKADDVCKAMGYKNTKCLHKHVDPKCTKLMTDDEGQHLYMSEPGFYSLIFSSRRPEAEQFVKWVFEKVLVSTITDSQFKSDDEPLMMNTIRKTTESLSR